MLRAQYSTVAQQSALMALGPFMPMTANAGAWPSNRSVIIQSGTTHSGYEALPADLELLIDSFQLQDEDALQDSSYIDMLTSEAILSRDWDSPEDNEAWADL